MKSFLVAMGVVAVLTLPLKSVTPSVQAGDAVSDKAEQIHVGMVLSINGDKLAMTDADGKNEHVHAVDGSAAVTIDGQPAKLLNLMKGDKVTVAVGQDGKVTRVAAVRTKK